MPWTAHEPTPVAIVLLATSYPYFCICFVVGKQRCPWTAHEPTPIATVLLATSYPVVDSIRVGSVGQ